MGTNSTPILVVDDHEATRKGLARLLHHSGYSALTAADGQAALDVLRTHVPQAIILDMMMPGIGGLDVLREIRRDQRLAHVPVIAFSAAASLEAQALAAGAHLFLLKGAVGWSNLTDAIERLTTPAD
jgi:CheY-like chemotaxis protein